MTFMNVMHSIERYLDKVSDSKGGFCMWNIFLGFMIYEALSTFAYNLWSLFAVDLMMICIFIGMISTHPVWKMQSYE